MAGNAFVVVDRQQPAESADVNGRNRQALVAAHIGMRDMVAGDTVAAGKVVGNRVAGRMIAGRRVAGRRVAGRNRGSVTDNGRLALR